MQSSSGKPVPWHPSPAKSGDRGADRTGAARSIWDPGSRETQLRAWMLSALDGDQRDYRSLLEAVRPILLSFFARRLGALRSEVEDLVQDVLTAVHERRASYDRSRPFVPWLFAIARHKLVDQFRKGRRLATFEPLELLDEMPVSEDFQARSDARMDVAALLDGLPPKQARAIRLIRLRELSAAEAARMAGIGESDVKVSAHRGIRAMAARVARSGELFR